MAEKQPLLELEQVTKSVRRPHGGRQARPARGRGRDRQPDRAERRRQDDGLQPRHRALPPRLGRDPVRGPRPRRAPAAQDHPARHRADLPDAAPLPEHDGQGERHGRGLRPHALDGRRGDLPPAPRPPRGARDRRRSPRRSSRSSASASPATATSSRPTTSRTRTGGGSRSPARWRRTRGCCCSTSRRPA